MCIHHEEAWELMSEGKARIGIIGIGNSLAGDDGAGIEIVRRLREKWPDCSEVYLTTLEGDFFGITEILPLAERFIIVDSVNGEEPGCVVHDAGHIPGFSPSLHQTDIASVLDALKNIEFISPFPEWEIWGVTITQPVEFRESLSPDVQRGIEILLKDLNRLISGLNRD